MKQIQPLKLISQLIIQVTWRDKQEEQKFILKSQMLEEKFVKS